MKYFSSDFMAEYNTVLDQYSKKQLELDKEMAEKIDLILSTEVRRLEEITPEPFKKGTMVRTTDKKFIGEVVNCPVVINLRIDEDYYEARSGPQKYYKISNESDEEVITCEGQIRKVSVLVEACELQKDWGVEKQLIEFWADELELND